MGSLVNGDLVLFRYQAVAERTSDSTNAATMSYKVVGATGIAHGMSGSGNCKGNGTNVQACVGSFGVR